MTIGFSGDTVVHLSCSECTWETDIVMKPGMSFGLLIDEVTITLLGDCPNKATHQYSKD